MQLQMLILGQVHLVSMLLLLFLSVQLILYVVINMTYQNIFVYFYSLLLPPLLWYGLREILNYIHMLTYL